jgi:hypothetical protein
MRSNDGSAPPYVPERAIYIKPRLRISESNSVPPDLNARSMAGYTPSGGNDWPQKLGAAFRFDGGPLSHKPVVSKPREFRLKTLLLTLQRFNCCIDFCLGSASLMAS